MSRDTSLITWVSFAILAGTLLAWLNDSDRVVQYRAARSYGLPYKEVEIVGARPRNCDFLSAPIGEKNCFYEREYVVQWNASTTGRPITYESVAETNSCAHVDLDIQHVCYETRLGPEKGVADEGRARRIEIRWRRVEE